MYGGFAASHVGMVHQVIVQQGVVVVSFDAHSRGCGMVDVVLVQAISHEQQGGAQAFASHREHIFDRFVQPLGLLG